MTACQAGVERWSVTGAPDREGRVRCGACEQMVHTTPDPVRPELRVIAPHGGTDHG